MSIIFIGTPTFAVPSLVRLADAGHEIAAVITQPDRVAGRGRKTRISPVNQTAAALGLPVLQPVSLRDRATLEEIRSLKPEVMAAVAYGQLLRPEFLEIAPKGVVNVHPSLLPKYRGASPIQSAILAGDEATGVTIMLMDAGMDSGPILAQEGLPIEDTDTGGSLSDKLAQLGARLLGETLPAWLAGNVEPQPQDDTQATTTRLLKKEDGLIDWNQPAVQIWRRVRAFDPWPGTFSRLGDERLSIVRAHPDVGSANPGEIVEVVSEDRTMVIAVGTGEGLLGLDEVQREGRKRMTAHQFARGARNLIGAVLR